MTNVGVPAAGTMHEVKAMPIERAFALTFAAVAATSASEPPASAWAPAIFSTSDRAPDAPAPRGVQRVLDRDVVVGDDRGDLHPAGDEVGGHLEVQDVTGVVLDDVEHPRPAVDGAGRGLHLIGDRRREHVAGTGSVQHAHSHEAAVERLVARAAAGQQGDLAPTGCVLAKDDVVGGVDADEVGVSEAEALEALGDHVLDGVDELLHRADRCGGCHGRMLLGALGPGWPRRGRARRPASAPSPPRPDELVQEGADQTAHDRAGDVHPQLAEVGRVADERLEDLRADLARRIEGGTGDRADQDDHAVDDEPDGDAGEPGRRLARTRPRRTR